MIEEKNFFSYKPVTSEKELTAIYSLKIKKRWVNLTISVKILKMCNGSFLPI